ncbi:AAA family ATPase [Alteromonas sp. H39]|uniref:AAA family ATPase n=1 Tax=Alteromonas sp. H39 TaxID=3389876 RepID=UPI0039E1CB80
MTDFYSEQFINLKHLLKPEQDDRLLVIKLAKSLDNIGYASIYFEITESGLTKVDNSEFSKNPDLPEIFITSGYQYLEKQYNNKLFIIKASRSEEDIEGRHCKYVCYATQHKKTHTPLKTDMGYLGEIADQRFEKQEDLVPHAFNYRIVNNEQIHFDSPFLFQLNQDSSELLGPLYQVHGEKDIFSGPAVEVRLPFWRRNRNEYQAFLINISGYEDKHIVTLNRDGELRRFIINLERLLLSDSGKPRNEAFQNIDMVPNNVLLNQFYDSADKLENIKPQPKNKVKGWIKDRKIALTDDRKKTVVSMLLAFEDEVENIEEIYKNILNSPKAENFLKQIALDNAEIYLQKIHEQSDTEVEEVRRQTRQRIEEITSQTNSVMELLEEKKEELDEVIAEKETKQEELDRLITKELQNVRESKQYQEELQRQDAELASIQQKLKDATEMYGQYDDHVALNSKIEMLKSRKSVLDDDVRELKNTIDGLEQSLGQKTQEYAVKFIESSVISDIVGYDFDKYLKKSKAEENVDQITYVTPASREGAFWSGRRNSDRKAVLSEIKSRLNKSKRFPTDVFLEATLISILQNQFTVFMGVPGTGKTSFARQLSYVLGAAKSTLLVPIAKEWTRPRDLMGYFNPISKRFESGNTKFKAFYDSLGDADISTTTNSFLILDEFNLSQPEYYMSPLTLLADEGNNRVIDLGFDHSVSIPSTSRFICTANNDDTVQSLTPRMISRCAFIAFDDLPELENTQEQLQYFEDLPPILPGEDLIELFTPTATDLMPKEMESYITTLIKTLRGIENGPNGRVNITPRKYNQLISFCRVMNNEVHDQNRILDNAMRIFILPLLSGKGEQFESMLVKLQEHAENFSLEGFSREVQSLLDIGRENFGYYQFSMG